MREAAHCAPNQLSLRVLLLTSRIVFRSSLVIFGHLPAERFSCERCESETNSDSACNFSLLSIADVLTREYLQPELADGPPSPGGKAGVRANVFPNCRSDQEELQTYNFRNRCVLVRFSAFWCTPLPRARGAPSIRALNFCETGKNR